MAAGSGSLITTLGVAAMAVYTSKRRWLLLKLYVSKLLTVVLDFGLLY